MGIRRSERIERNRRPKRANESEAPSARVFLWLRPNSLSPPFSDDDADAVKTTTRKRSTRKRKKTRLDARRLSARPVSRDDAIRRKQPIRGHDDTTRKRRLRREGRASRRKTRAASERREPASGDRRVVRARARTRDRLRPLCGSEKAKEEEIWEPRPQGPARRMTREGSVCVCVCVCEKKAVCPEGAGAPTLQSTLVNAQKTRVSERRTKNRWRTE